MSKKMQEAIHEVIEALKDGVSHSGDAIVMRARHMKAKTLDINGRWTETDELLSSAVKDSPSRKPDGISREQYRNLLDLSTHNPDAPHAVLGKFKEPPMSYIEAAQSGHPPGAYFSLGAEWGDIKASTGLTDKGMFKAFNIPFLDKVIADGKDIKFSHNPLGDPGALGDELRYLMSKGYIFDPKTMTAVKL